jgi:hypothetical protein
MRHLHPPSAVPGKHHDRSPSPVRSAVNQYTPVHLASASCIRVALTSTVGVSRLFAVRKQSTPITAITITPRRMLPSPPFISSRITVAESRLMAKLASARLRLLTASQNVKYFARRASHRWSPHRIAGLAKSAI